MARHGFESTRTYAFLHPSHLPTEHLSRIKNSRLLAEFREIDSYLTDSSDDEGDSLRPTTFDSSILKMGRALVQAAHSNPIQGTTTPPKVIMRLTRLEPDAPSADPRISQTLDLLKDMGIDVQLGERSQSELDASSHTHPTPQTTPTLIPSHRINLDLSVLIALISDLTHAPLPVSVEAAHKRFIPPKEYREWKQSKRQQANKASSMSIEPEELTISDLPHDFATHARALTHQLLNEMCRSLIQYIHSQIRPDTEFWVTKEARDRCLRIVSKIGAVNEKRRAYALFLLDPSDSSPIPIDCAEQLFWQNSRYSPGILPLFPLYFHDETLASSTEWEKTPAELLQARPSRHTFFKDLEGTCQWILDQEATADPCPMPTTEPRISSNTDLPRAPLTKTNPRLTTHTVTSLLCGARLGWTTLTANRTSIKAIMKEVRARGGARALSSGQEREGENLKESEDVKAQQQTFQEAAIWIIDPRSLAEQMAGGQA